MTEELKGPLFGSKNLFIMTEEDALRVVDIIFDDRIDAKGPINYSIVKILCKDFVKKLYKLGLAIAVKMKTKDSNVGKRARLLGIIGSWSAPKED